MNARDVAIQSWVEEKLPGLSAQISGMLGNKAVNSIFALAFEAGRQFQDDTGAPLDDPNVYLKPWTTFWFEGNQAFGIVDSASKWHRVVRAYSEQGGVDFLRGAKSNPHTVRDMPSFGFAAEYTGPETLGDWADKKGVALSRHTRVCICS
ncbi:MAG: hypothetical protein HY455_03045 [Parcubacteria group bacterium]|nr:hypothetical protein [Parcubacteria group bacterium]